ncbi:hypothetical protein [Nannocystis pusilla]|uniref:hypothetical protein n=1 Tax=Nannocystis pusilla TaxID=889268 RepID=UPI003B79E388
MDIGRLVVEVVGQAALDGVEVGEPGHGGEERGHRAELEDALLHEAVLEAFARYGAVALQAGLGLDGAVAGDAHDTDVAAEEFVGSVGAAEAEADALALAEAAVLAAREGSGKGQAATGSSGSVLQRPGQTNQIGGGTVKPGGAAVSHCSLRVSSGSAEARTRLSGTTSSEE